MSRDEAIAALTQCPQCRRWITVPDCDHCLMDRHRCPPTPAEAQRLLARAVEIAREAEHLRRALGAMSS